MSPRQLSGGVLLYRLMHVFLGALGHLLVQQSEWLRGFDRCRQPMHYWQAVLGEVANKHDKNYPFYYTTLYEQSEKYRFPLSERRTALSTYGLGCRYPDVHFTQREAECMVYLLKGMTNAFVAELMGLSPRTIEYYIKNMRTKLCCKNKNELVQRVKGSDFLSNVDF